MKSLLQHKQRKALRKAKRTGEDVVFWRGGDSAYLPVDDREYHIKATPDDEVYRVYPHHYDGRTHYMEYSTRIW